MKIEFIGGARSVTGSMLLLNIKDKKILLECGIFQGRRKDTHDKNKNFRFNPEEIDVLLLSHAHIDHSGNIPNLVKSGLKGNIYATSATLDLCQIMLKDSAHLQEMDIAFLNKKLKKKGEPLFEPLYELEDVEIAMSHFVGIQYNRQFELFPGINVTFRDAGHILGSAGIQLDIEEAGRKTRFGFSGDIGRSNSPVIRAPDVLRDLDILVMESTYGNKLHSEVVEIEEEISQIIKEVFSRNGKIIVPAFAIGRTQSLVYLLHKLFNQNRIPEIPIYVDSPLAFNATNVFRSHPECMDRETHRIFLKDGSDPFGFERLIYTKTVEESKRLNNMKEPMIIISASGMAEGGRILHHLANNIEDTKNLILFVGYAAKNTLARKIIDGEKVVKILGETYNLNCDVKVFDYFSAHADKKELLDYMKFNPPNKLKNLFLVHGEEEQAISFISELKSIGYQNVNYPDSGEIYEI